MNEFKRTPDAKANGLTGGEAEIRSLLQDAGPRPVLPAEDLAAIRATALAEWQRLVGVQQKPTRHWARWALPLAASLLLAALGAWWWTSVQPPAVPDLIATVELLKGDVGALQPEDWEHRLELAVGKAIPVGAELETETGGDGSAARLALRLEGGQSLRLDTDTRVRLVSDSSIELQRGAVYLDSGAAAPGGAAVDVLTRFGTVRDIGTQYEVRLDGGPGATLRVRVRDGEVSLESGRFSYSAVSGEELTLRRDRSVARASVQLHGTEWDWVLAATPSIDIEGRSLRSFLDWIATETGLRIRYADAALEESATSVLLHGSIRGLRPDESLSVVLPGSGLTYRIEDGTLFVTRPVGDQAES